jgi:cbb3-type cytochrome oxidase maturation protein
MEILYLLIPLSAVLVLAIIGVFGWALNHGQFEDLEQEGQRILDAGHDTVDDDQASRQTSGEQSSQSTLVSR